MAIATGTLIAMELAATAIGTGISVYSQNQAAKQQQNIARYNFAMQQKQAQQQQQMAVYQQSAMNQQAGVMQAQAEINNALAQNESQARLNNAEALRIQSENQANTDRQNIMSTKRDQARQLAIQRSRMAKSGAAESGSFVDLLAETGGEMQRVLEDLQFQSDAQRRQTQGAANVEEFEGKMSSANAFSQLGAGRAEADFTKMSAALEGAKGAAQAAATRREARINLLTGESNASGLRLAAVGSLVSGLGSMAGQWTSWRNMAGSAGQTSNFATMARKNYSNTSSFTF